IRGGIPICWPWFGPHATDPDKPAHGFVRTMAWSVVGSEGDPDSATRLRLALHDTDATRAIWPGRRFELELTISVAPILAVELVVRNTGSTSFTCTGALHTYFGVSDISRVTVEGLDGCAYLDKVLEYQRSVQQGAIRIAAETDRIYVDTEADCLIRDEGWQR